MNPVTALTTVSSKYRHVLYAQRYKLMEEGIPCGRIYHVQEGGRITGYRFKHWHSGPKVNLA